jgi:hypothetical protein
MSLSNKAVAAILLVAVGAGFVFALASSPGIGSSGSSEEKVVQLRLVDVNAPQETPE